MQTFWVGMVMAIDRETVKKLKLTGAMGDKIKAGDIILYVNTFMCMVDRSQARNGVEFCQALRDVILNAAAPRAIRLARCRFVMIEGDVVCYQFTISTHSIKKTHQPIQSYHSINALFCI